MSPKPQLDATQLGELIRDIGDARERGRCTVSTERNGHTSCQVRWLASVVEVLRVS